MKIISKYKDYYDYLIGTYGIDPKLVLDRRQGTRLQEFHATSFTLAICGNLVDVFYDGEKCYCGNGLRKVGKELETSRWCREISGTKKEKQILIKYTTPSGYGVPEKQVVNLYAYTRPTALNDKHGVPILRVASYGDNYHFPHLGDCNIGSLYPPEEMFQMLTNWLSQKITEAENIVDTRDDVAKLLDKGFDKKCSFRPKAKKCS